MPTPSKVLFISHDAWRTGAPIVLLHLLEWLKQNTKIPFEIVLRSGGELERDFAAVAPTSVVDPCRSVPHQVVKHVLQKVGLDYSPGTSVVRRLQVRLQAGEFGLIYSNTITNGALVQSLGESCPVITHVHELDHWIRHHTGLEEFSKVKAQTTHFIAGSNAVRRNLVENHGIPEEKIDRVYEGIRTGVLPPEKHEGCRRALREQLGLSPTALIVGAAGTTDWRKGPDLFVQLAGEVRRLSESPEMHFVWMGGVREGLVYEQLRHDAVLQGVGDRVHFLGVRTDYREIIAAYDLFVLSSREDPFPLVTLEAAAVGKPILCFQGAGGSPEFVGDDCGFILPFLDIRGMAEKALELARSPELRERLGRRGTAKVLEGFDIAVAGRLIASLITRLCPTVAFPAR